MIHEELPSRLVGKKLIRKETPKLFYAKHSTIDKFIGKEQAYENARLKRQIRKKGKLNYD